MVDWRAKIDRMLDQIHDAKKLHLIFNIIVAIWGRGEP